VRGVEDVREKREKVSWVGGVKATGERRGGFCWAEAGWQVTRAKSQCVVYVTSGNAKGCDFLKDMERPESTGLDWKIRAERLARCLSGA